MVSQRKSGVWGIKLSLLVSIPGATTNAEPVPCTKVFLAELGRQITLLAINE